MLARPSAQCFTHIRSVQFLDRTSAERDILKNDLGGRPPVGADEGRSLLREGSDMKFAFIAKHRSIWPVAWQCEALGVSRSGFHAWLTRCRSTRALIDEALLPRIRASFASSARTYGARRVWRDTLTSVVFVDSVLTFTYTLDATLDKIDADRFLQVEAHIREMTWKEEDAIMFFRYGGGTQRFSWYDRNGKLIGKLDVDANSCA
jgi:hypothetical protein